MAGLEPARANYGNQKLDSLDDIPINVLVPVAGVSVDKTLALRDDPSTVAQIDHVHSGNISQAYAELCDAIKARANPKADQAPTAQLALRNGEADSGSGGLKPVRSQQTKTPKNMHLYGEKRPSKGPD